MRKTIPDPVAFVDADLPAGDVVEGEAVGRVAGDGGVGDKGIWRGRGARGIQLWERRGGILNPT